MIYEVHIIDIKKTMPVQKIDRKFSQKFCIQFKSRVAELLAIVVMLKSSESFECQ